MENPLKRFLKGRETQKEPGWTKERLGEHSELERHGPEIIGSEFEIIYTQGKEKERKMVRGIVVESSEAQTTIQDQVTNELIAVNVNGDTIVSARSRQLAEKPSQFKEMDFTEVYTALHNGESLYGVCVIGWRLHPDKIHTVVRGNIVLEKISDSYEILKVTDEKGVEHLVDPDRIQTNFAISKSPEDLAHIHSSKEKIEIVDTERSERLQLVGDLLNEYSVLDNPKYYKYFAKDAERTKKLLDRWYRADTKIFNIQDAIAQIEGSFGEEYLALLTDPGIVHRFDSFLEFATNLKESSDSVPSPMELRTLFSEHLGTKSVFRGMMLTPEEYAFIQKHGIVAPALTDRARASRILEETFDTAQRKRYARHARSIYHDITGGRMQDFFEKQNLLTLSVSKYEPVARSAGYHSSRELETPGKQLYLFECEVPELSLLRHENVFEYHRRMKGTMKVGEFEVNQEKDLDVEIFIPFGIPREQIKRMTRIEEVPPVWENHEPKEES